MHTYVHTYTSTQIHTYIYIYIQSVNDDTYIKNWPNITADIQEQGTPTRAAARAFHTFARYTGIIR